MLNQTCIIPFGFSGASHFTNTVTGLTGWATTFLGGVPGAEMTKKKKRINKNEKQRIPHRRNSSKIKYKIVERGKIATSSTQIHVQCDCKLLPLAHKYMYNVIVN